MWGECGGAGTRATKTAQADTAYTPLHSSYCQCAPECTTGMGGGDYLWLWEYDQRQAAPARLALLEEGQCQARPETGRRRGCSVGALREGLYNTEKWRPARIHKRHVRRGRRSKRSCVCLEQLALLARRLGLGARAGLEAKARGEGRGEKCSGAGCTREARRRPKPGREGVRPLHGRLH